MKWTPEALEDLQKRLDNLSRSEVAEYYSITPNAISMVAARHGLKINKQTNNRKLHRDASGKFANPLKIDTPPRRDPFRKAHETV